MSEKQPNAVVLLSGGLDSATVLAIARAEGFLPAAISFRYGQRHAIELEAARQVARSQGVARHVILDIDLAQFGGSALTADIPVPKHEPGIRDQGSGVRDQRSVDGLTPDPCLLTPGPIPVTYVPARNTVFLSLALAFAETIGTGDLFVGVNALDYSGYPDCRPEYIAAFERMANLATKGAVQGTLPVKIHAPLIDLTKAQIIRRGLALGVDYSLTRSCYDPAQGGIACGHCDSCLLRLKGFAENGLADPIAYAR